MLNRRFIQHELTMSPSGSLNRMPVQSLLLDQSDPLVHQGQVTGAELVSRGALLKLLTHCQHSEQHSLRKFLTHYTPDDPADQYVMTLFSRRFSAVINTARSGQPWLNNDEALSNYWQSITTLTISGGLTSHQFGLHLAEQVEKHCKDIAVIASPWGGLTALYGLAQTVANRQDLVVMDFGATGIKRGVAQRYGNRITLLPELKVAYYKQEGLIRKSAMLSILKQTQQEIGRSLPVAISLACYLENGHPFDYRSGVYHRLGEDSHHLADDLNSTWLPECGFSELALLEHDSTAAALAFKFRDPAMMITLGTGLGSAPCPKI